MLQAIAALAVTAMCILAIVAGFRLRRTADVLEKAYQKVGEAAAKVLDTVSRIERIVADEKTATLPVEAAQFLSRGKELMVSLNETSELLRNVINGPAETMMRMSGTVMPVIEDARKKVNLVRAFLEAVRTGIGAGWSELRPTDGKDMNSEVEDSVPIGEE